jgi:hypothetical protein
MSGFSDSVREIKITCLMRTVIAILALCFAGCAHRGEMGPPEPVLPISGFAMLPAVMQAQVRPPRTPAAGGGAYVSGGGNRKSDLAAALVIGAVAGIFAARDADERVQLERGMAAIAFQPTEILNARLKTLLEQRGLKVETLAEDEAAMQARRSGDYQPLQTVADAVLDIRIDELGYFHTIRAHGYSPMFGMTVFIYSPRRNLELARFSYYYDWREAKGNRRWLTSPSSMMFDRAEELADNADAIRAGFEDVLDQMMALLADDLKRRAEGLAAD